MTAPPCNKHRNIYQFLPCELYRSTYLFLKDNTYTDYYTALTNGESRVTSPTVLCSAPLSITLYRETGNFAVPVFASIFAGAEQAW